MEDQEGTSSGIGTSKENEREEERERYPGRRD
jgi:hypothetical protein